MVNFLGEQFDPSPELSETTITEYPEVEEHIDAGLPAKRDPFDPAPVKELFKKFHLEIDKMESKAMAIEVKDDASLKIAVEMTTQVKALFQRCDKNRINEKAPYKRIVDVLDGETGDIKKRTLQIESRLNKKIGPYLLTKEQERIAAEFKAREEAARVQAEMDAIAAKEREEAFQAAKQAAVDSGMSGLDAEMAGMEAAKMVEPAPVVVAQELPTETKVQTESGTAKLKEKFVGELVDIRAIPDACVQSRWEELKKAVQPYINAQIAAGARNVPGFKIFKQAKIETRTSKKNFKF